MAATKGESTRTAILEHAVDLASAIGLSGLTIGRLSADLGLSKSGLFAHFRSKETLQAQVLEAASRRFVETVIRPALASPRGEPRARALFTRWLAWARSQQTPGGCIFVGASVELDDRPGPVRERLVDLQRQWLGVIAEVARSAVAHGSFRRDLDPEQFAHDLYAIMLGYHHASRLLQDERAEARAEFAFEALLSASRLRDTRRHAAVRTSEPRNRRAKTRRKRTTIEASRRRRG